MASSVSRTASQSEPSGPRSSVSEINLRSTSNARDKFLSNLSGPSIPVSGVRPFIYQSWERSASEGIQSEQFGAPIIDSSEKVASLRHKNSDLCRAARGSFEQIGKMLSDTEAMLILTDSAGVVIETNGDKSTLEFGRKINLGLGGLWSENASGTNGIGTALWTGQPAFVHGTEHFCEGMRAWSCAAAPIRDPLDNTILGVVDLSGLTTIFQKHNAAFAVAAAGEIQAVLAQDQNMQHVRLLEAVIGKMSLNTSGHEGLVVIDHLGRIIFTRNLDGSHWIREKDLNLYLGQGFANMSNGMSDTDILASLPEELECTEIRHLQIDGELKGAALVFKPQHTRQHYSVNSPKPAEPGILIAGTELKIVGESPQILEAIEALRQVENVNTPTLIEGETGVGKELFARYIRSQLDPADKEMFVVIHCGAVSKKMFVDALFRPSQLVNGNRGSGDAQSRQDLAFGGVFCLDEIGELPIDVQPRLLRALDDQHAMQNFDGQILPKNFRLISMTNRNLHAEVLAGQFRSDLFYRLSAVTLKIPPLRARGDDILLIAEYFNRQFAANLGKIPLLFGADANDEFLGYRWPGNVRELRNVVAALHHKAKNRHICKDNLPAEIVDPVQPVAGTIGLAQHDQKAAESFKQSEKNLILKAISKHQGNLSKTAATLGISRPTLYRKMNIYSIEKYT